MTVDPEVMYLLVALTLAALAATSVFAWRTRRFLARAVRTQGRVARITMDLVEFGGTHGQQEESVPYYSNHVQFQTEDGAALEFCSRVRHPRSSLYHVGQTVPVAYDRSNPQATAEIEGAAIWRPTIFAGIGATLLLLVTALMKACSV